MVLFLTSIIGPRGADGRIIGIHRRNCFLEQLKLRWKMAPRILIMAADPASSRNNGWIDVMKCCCEDGGLPYERIDLCDNNRLDLADRVRSYDVLVLAGGHPQTQNGFFHRIGLGQKIKGFQGIVIGISAGSMNSASEVYIHVERPGETQLRREERFMPGLGLTDLMIIPHFQELQDEMLDGKNVIRDVACPDSEGRTFLCLNDGSYVLAEAGREVLFGEAFCLRDGVLETICRDGESLRMS